MQSSTRGAESRYNKTWLVLAFVYTYMYAGVAFLSHMYLGVMSIAGAVWTYLFLHAFAYVMLFELQRVKPSTSQLDLAQRNSNRMVNMDPDA